MIRWRSRVLISLVILVLVLVPVACTGNGDGGAKKDGGPLVVTTIYPVHFFASEILGDKGKVVNLIPAGSEPHHWEPTPGDMVTVGKADALIYNGAGMEKWIPGFIKELGGDVKFIDCSEGIDLLQVNHRTGGHGHEEYMIDPHIWLDPQNAVVMVGNITEGICAVDPGNASYYLQRQDDLVAKLRDLHVEYSQALQDLKGKEIVVSHAAFGYLARRYGLEQIAVRGLSAEMEPGPARVAEIVNTIRDKNIKCVFFDALVSPKVSKTIAREAGVKVLRLHTLGALSLADEKNGENYFTLMRENLVHLKEGLSDE